MSQVAGSVMQEGGSYANLEFTTPMTQPAHTTHLTVIFHAPAIVKSLPVNTLLHPNHTYYSIKGNFKWHCSIQY